MNATRQRLPNSLTYRVAMLTWQAPRALGMSLIYWRPNLDAKPPFDGVLSAWRSHHVNSPITHKQGRALALPLKRATQWRMTKRLGQMASLAEMPHNQTRIHDGQEWTLQAIPCPKPIRSGVTQWTR